MNPIWRCDLVASKGFKQFMRSMLACLKFVTVFCRAEVHDCLHVFVLSRVFCFGSSLSLVVTYLSLVRRSDRVENRRVRHCVEEACGVVA